MLANKTLANKILALHQAIALWLMLLYCKTPIAKFLQLQAEPLRGGLSLYIQFTELDKVTQIP
jgi:hypothetical protein